MSQVPTRLRAELPRRCITGPEARLANSHAKSGTDWNQGKCALGTPSCKTKSTEVVERKAIHIENNSEIDTTSSQKDRLVHTVVKSAASWRTRSGWRRSAGRLSLKKTAAAVKLKQTRAATARKLAR